MSQVNPRVISEVPGRIEQGLISLVPTSSQVLSIEQRALAGRLLSAVARAMCAMAYRRQEHEDHVFLRVVEPSDYDEERQRIGATGALFSHMSTSAYERIAASMDAWGVARKHAGDVLRMVVDADSIGELATSNVGLDRNHFEEAVLSFLSFDYQKQWPDGYFSHDLIADFMTAGLLESKRGTLCWTDEMFKIWETAQDWPVDPNEFFLRICVKR